MKIKRNIDGKDVEIELTQNEMSLAYEQIRRSTWEFCIRDQIESNSDNLKFNNFYTEEEFVDECMEAMEERYYADDYDEKAEEVVFDVAESNGVWVDYKEDDDDE